MAGKTTDAIIAEGEQIIRVWEANPDFSLGDLKLADLKAMVSGLRTKRQSLEDLRTQVTHLVNQTNDGGKEIMAIVTRARSGFRAMYGPDSSQYEQAGGTRQSERRPRATKKKGS